MALSKIYYKKRRPRSTNTLDSALKVQYKEYTFETNPDKEIKEKVASFWEALGDRKPLNTDVSKFPKSKIKDCVGGSGDKIITTDELNITQKEEPKWKLQNTFCLFKKKGLHDKACDSKKCFNSNKEKVVCGRTVPKNG